MLVCFLVLINSRSMDFVNISGHMEEEKLRVYKNIFLKVFIILHGAKFYNKH